jgi:hypothetical protein
LSWGRIGIWRFLTPDDFAPFAIRVNAAEALHVSFVNGPYRHHRRLPLNFLQPWRSSAPRWELG